MDYSRTREFGRSVDILGTKEEVDFSVEPAEKNPAVSQMLTSIFGPSPRLMHVEEFLGLTLMNINALWHPFITYARFRDWDGVTPFTEIPLFYEGLDPEGAELISQASDEVLAIKRAVQAYAPHMKLEAVVSGVEWITRAYGSQVYLVVQSCMQTHFISHITFLLVRLAH